MKRFLAVLCLMLSTCGYSPAFAAPQGLVPYPKFRAVKAGTSTPLAGGKLYTLQAGTTGLGSLVTTYTSATGATPNTNPVILNSSGECDLWYDGTLRLALYDSNNVLVWNRDNISSMAVADNTVVDNQVWTLGTTPTYVSATQFTAIGNKLTVYPAGISLKATVSAGTIYGIVVSSSYDSTKTSVNCLWQSGNALDGGLSAVYTGTILETSKAGYVISAHAADNTTAHNFSATLTATQNSFSAWIAFLPTYRNLKVTTTADNLSVTLTADSLVVVTALDNAKLLKNVSVTCNLANAGANGLDAGTAQANTGYFIWVIDNGTTTACLASQLDNTPTLPAGFTHKGLFSWVTTDNQSSPGPNIKEFTQVDDVYRWDARDMVAGVDSTTTAAIDLKAGGLKTFAVVPAAAKSVFFKTWNSGGNCMMVASKTFANSSTCSSDPGSAAYDFLTPATGNFMTSGEVALVEAQTIYAQTNGTADDYIYFVGFRLKR